MIHTQSVQTIRSRGHEWEFEVGHDRDYTNIVTVTQRYTNLLDGEQQLTIPEDLVPAFISYVRRSYSEIRRRFPKHGNKKD